MIYRVWEIDSPTRIKEIALSDSMSGAAEMFVRMFTDDPSDGDEFNLMVEAPDGEQAEFTVEVEVVFEYRAYRESATHTEGREK